MEEILSLFLFQCSLVVVLKPDIVSFIMNPVKSIWFHWMMLLVMWTTSQFTNQSDSTKVFIIDHLTFACRSIEWEWQLDSSSLIRTSCSCWYTWQCPAGPLHIEWVSRCHWLIAFEQSQHHNGVMAARRPNIYYSICVHSVGALLDAARLFTASLHSQPMCSLVTFSAISKFLLHFEREITV